MLLTRQNQANDDNPEPRPPKNTDQTKRAQQNDETAVPTVQTKQTQPNALS